MLKKVVVFAEQKNGNIRNVSLECLTAARRMADTGEIIAVLFGEGQQYAEQLGRYGADRVVVVSNDNLKTYTADAYKQAILSVIDSTAPDAVLMGHTAIGKDVAPRVAAKLGVGLISDCIDIKARNQEIEYIRPIYAGKAFQKKRFADSSMALVTIRSNNIRMEENPRNPVVESVSADIQDLRTVVKEVVQRTSAKVDLTEANVVVAGGRGLKGKEAFGMLQDLADVLGGAVGASRGACDSGYCDYSMQIGQTGKVVTPELYLACGISGAIQHLAGMSQSRVIVAINKDPDAPIFQVADYGIVGDLFEVVPLLIEEFKSIKNG